MSINPSLCTENILFDLFSGFIDVTISTNQQKNRILAQWDHFKKLIMMKPIDYHQVYSFISKLTIEADYYPKDNNITNNNQKEVSANDQQQPAQNNSQSTSQSQPSNNNNNLYSKNKSENQQQQQQSSAAQQNPFNLNQQNSTKVMAVQAEKPECFDDIIDNQTTVHNNNNTVYAQNQHIQIQQQQQFVNQQQSNVNNTATTTTITVASASGEDSNYKNLYIIQKFSEFFRKSGLLTTPFAKVAQNSFYMSSYIIELQNQNNSLLKYVAIYHFKALLTDTYNDHQKNPIYDLFLQVQNKKIKFNNCLSTYTPDQLYNSFCKNFALLLHQKHVLNLSQSKIAKNFLYQVCTDPVFLHALINTLKEIMAEFVENCDNETLTSFIHNNQINEQEKRTKLIQSIRQNWKEVKQEWFFLLTMAINRALEIHTIKENKLEKTIFSCKTKTHQRNASQNQFSEDRISNNNNTATSNNSSNNNNNQGKINLLSYWPCNNSAISSGSNSSSFSNQIQGQDQIKIPIYYLLINISELEIFENISSKFDTYISDDVNMDQILNIVNQQIMTYKKIEEKEQSKEFSTQISTNNQNQSINSLDSQLSKVSRLAMNLVNQNSSNTFLNNLSSISNSNQFNQQQIMSFHQQQQSEDNKKLRSACNANSPRVLSLNQPLSNYNQANSSSNNNAVNQGENSSTSKNASSQYRFGVQNKLSYFENPSPKYNFTTSLQKSSMNSSTKQIQDEWNRSLILSKAKELLFTLNIDSDKLNSVVKYSQGSSNAKENFNSRSPLKYKQVLYPMKSVSSDVKKHVSMLSAQQLQTQN